MNASLDIRVFTPRWSGWVKENRRLEANLLLGHGQNLPEFILEFIATSIFVVFSDEGFNLNIFLKKVLLTFFSRQFERRFSTRDWSSSILLAFVPSILVPMEVLQCTSSRKIISQLSEGNFTLIIFGMIRPFSLVTADQVLVKNSLTCLAKFRGSRM